MRFGQVSSKNLSSPNWLKFGAGVHCYILILNLMFIFSKFFKLIEIWYKGKLLYVYYDYKVYFFKILFIKLFFGKFGLKIWISSNWLKFRTGVNALLHTYYDFNVHFFKIFVILIFFCANYGFRIWDFPKLTEIWFRGTLLHAYLDFNAYFFKVLFSFIILGKFCPKIWSSPNQLKFGTKVHWYMLMTILTLILILTLHSNFFRQIWFQNLNFIKLTEIS